MEKSSNIYCFETFKSGKLNSSVNQRNKPPFEGTQYPVPEKHAHLEPFNGMKIVDVIKKGILPPIPSVNIDTIIKDYAQQDIEVYPVNWALSGKHCQFIRDRDNLILREEHIYDGCAEYTLCQDNLFYGSAGSGPGYERPYFLSWFYTSNKWELRRNEHRLVFVDDIDLTHDEIMEG